jgi:hypothetical protein
VWLIGVKDRPRALFTVLGVASLRSSRMGTPTDAPQWDGWRSRPIEHHLARELEQAYRVLEPTLTRYGYHVNVVAELLNVPTL